MLDSSVIRIVDNFPVNGIKFYDITTLLNNSEAFYQTIEEMLAVVEKINPEVVVGLEARGYFFAPIIAYQCHLPFVPIRKKGKLPAAVYQQSYGLEYGADIIEIHKDAFEEHKRVLLVDDVLASGGTMKATLKLIENFHPASVDILSLIELKDLKGREKLTNCRVHSLLQL